MNCLAFKEGTVTPGLYVYPQFLFKRWKFMLIFALPC